MLNFFSHKDGKNLCLKDYKEIKTRFCFLDESGSLTNPKDPIFTVGFIKHSQPYYLDSQIIYERSKRRYYDEMKFNKLSKKNIDFAILALDSFFANKGASFHSYSLDKKGNYFNTKFGGDPWMAYEGIVIQLLESNIRSNEILMVIADYMTTPKEVRFEVNTKWKINEKSKRLSIAGVCRFDSRSNNLLQLADLMIGAINYDIKLKTGLIKSGDKYKRKFLDHFKNNLGTEEFIKGFKNYNFNAYVDKSVIERISYEKL